MKVGFHGQEHLTDIIKRKQQEDKSHGYALWGYGGTLCHPHIVINPFIKSHNISETDLVVCFTVTNSPFVGSNIRATEYSSDGVHWNILDTHDVMDSRFALVISDIVPAHFDIDLTQYSIANGPSKGKQLSEYFRYRVDKAVAVRTPNDSESRKNCLISFTARLVEPYAISVRHQPLA